MILDSDCVFVIRLLRGGHIHFSFHCLTSIHLHANAGDRKCKLIQILLLSEVQFCELRELQICDQQRNDDTSRRDLSVRIKRTQTLDLKDCSAAVN